MTVAMLAGMVGGGVPAGKVPAWVHPSSGSDAAAGTSPDTPFATITKAISDGHNVIHVAAGTHTVLSIDAPVTLLMYPGTHTLLNAPVTSTVPFNMIAVQGRTVNRYNSGEATYVTGSGQDLIQIFNGTNDLHGGRFSGLRFNKASITRSAIYTSNVSGMTVDHCDMNWPSGNYEEKYLVWASGTSGHEVSDWVLNDNFVNRQSYVRITGAATFHNWFVSRDIGGGETNQAPGVRIINNSWFWADADCYGFALAGDSYEFGAGSNTEYNPAEGGYVWDGICQQSRIYAALAEGCHHNLGNCRTRMDDFRSSYVTHNLGDSTVEGNLKVNGSYYTGDYDIANAATKYSRVVVQARW